MEPSPYSGVDFAEVVVAMGNDCSVKSGKVLDEFTVHAPSLNSPPSCIIQASWLSSQPVSSGV
jgi:hypothetical protein